MAVRKRSTWRSGRLLSLFVIRRAKQLRFNPEVSLAVERFSGKPFAKVWARIKCAVFDAPLKRRKGRR